MGMPVIENMVQIPCTRTLINQNRKNIPCTGVCWTYKTFNLRTSTSTVSVSKSCRYMCVNGIVIRLRESREALASWKYITIELEDGLPAALRDMYGPN